MTIEKWNKCIKGIYDDKELLEKTADCDLVVGKQTFRVHKWIIAAQAPLFLKAIINQAESSIIPEEFQKQTIEAILRYCYHGYLDDATLTGDGAEAILELATHLGMDGLKKDVETGLAKSINAGNTVRRARLADKCSFTWLMKACVVSIAVNKAEVLELEEWAALVEEKPKLTSELLKRAMLIQGEIIRCGWTRECMVAKRNEDISRLYGDEIGTDCSILVGGETLRAHKSILMAHSPIFREMFTHPLSLEAESGVAAEKSIPDPDAFRELIRYCYHGGLASWKVERMNELGVHLFQLADKYCIAELKKGMERRLVPYVNEASVVGMALLADSHCANTLKQACIKFIVKEKSVTKSAEWGKMRKERPVLAAELLEGVATMLREERDAAKEELAKEKQKSEGYYISSQDGWS